MLANVQVTFRHTAKLPEIEELVHRQMSKLEAAHGGLTGGRVAIEQPQQHQQTGNPYRVRIAITAPGASDIVVVREPGDSDMHTDLHALVLGAFKAAGRQLRRQRERQRGHAKRRDEPRALVVRLFPDEGYGFLKAPDGREIYLHRNSVLHGDFDRLAIGTEVRFAEGDGDEGPQASSVQIVNKPGVRLAGEAASPVIPPRGWEARGSERDREAPAEPTRWGDT